jgi:2-polyprenyl-3-methyl-5-hydroxy-6-metoxy-1,4-benzoquinol methylase
MNENSIRPDDLREGQRLAVLADVGFLLSHYNEFVPVDCPACGESGHRHWLVKMGLEYARCSACGTGYVSPRPNPELLKAFYRQSRNYAYWNANIFPSTDLNRREMLMRPRLERVLDAVREAGIEQGRLLEIGAAFGSFCRLAIESKQFSEVVGLEPTPDLAASCREQDIQVIESALEDIDKESAGLFDVIVAFEVIEHTFCPGTFLAMIVGLLAPGGLAILTCPNIDGFDIATLGKESDAVDHEHLNYFNPASLALLARRVGLEPIATFTPGRLDAELVRKKVLAGAICIDQQVFLETVLISRWDQLGGAFQEFIASNMLSSHLWIVARKPFGSGKNAVCQ